MAGRSLTGDALTDRMVPVAMRLVGAVHEFDSEGVAEALAEADATGIADARHVLIVVLAAMVPYDKSPSQMLAWSRRQTEYERLTDAGVDAATAATIVHQLTRED